MVKAQSSRGKMVQNKASSVGMCQTTQPLLAIERFYSLFYEQWEAIEAF